VVDRYQRDPLYREQVNNAPPKGRRTQGSAPATALVAAYLQSLGVMPRGEAAVTGRDVGDFVRSIQYSYLFPDYVWMMMFLAAIRFALLLAIAICCMRQPINGGGANRRWNPEDGWAKMTRIMYRIRKIQMRFSGSSLMIGRCSPVRLPKEKLMQLDRHMIIPVVWPLWRCAVYNGVAGNGLRNWFNLLRKRILHRKMQCIFSNSGKFLQSVSSPVLHRLSTFKPDAYGI